MNDRFNNYRVETIRNQNHEYNSGVYHIIVCTKNRIPYFGEIKQAQNGNIMLYSQLGLFLYEQIRNISSHYTYAEIPIWQIMPDHLHLLVIIKDNTNNKRTNAINDLQQLDVDSNTINEKMKLTSDTKSALSVVIGGLKSSVTKYANENKISFAWQPRFYDQIIWNQQMINEVAVYIQNNVYAWNVYGYNDI